MYIFRFLQTKLLSYIRPLYNVNFLTHHVFKETSNITLICLLISRVTQICVANLAIIGLDNGLSPGLHQAIIWTNAARLLIVPFETIFGEFLVVIQTCSSKKMHLKMSFAKWRPFCLCLSVLMFNASCWGLHTNVGLLRHIFHDDVMKWKHFPRNWSFVRWIHRSPVNSPHKGQWRGALMFSLICVWINDWVNNREAGDLRRYRAHYDVIVMHLLIDISWIWVADDVFTCICRVPYQMCWVTKDVIA